MEIEIEGSWRKIGLAAGAVLGVVLLLAGLYVLGRRVSIRVAGHPLYLTPARYRSTKYNGFLVREYNALVDVDAKLLDALDESKPFEERVEAVDAANEELERVHEELEKANPPTAVMSERTRTLAECGGMYGKAADELVKALVRGRAQTVVPAVEEARGCLKEWK